MWGQVELICFLNENSNYAVGNAEWDDGDLAARYFDIFELGEIERVAAELDPHFFAAQRASVKKLLVYEKGSE